MDLRFSSMQSLMVEVITRREPDGASWLTCIHEHSSYILYPYDVPIVSNGNTSCPTVMIAVIFTYIHGICGVIGTYIQSHNTCQQLCVVK